MSAYAAAAESIYNDMLEFWRNLGGPRVRGQYCPWPCIDPKLVIDHNIRADAVFLFNGYRYQGRI